jgi:thymidine kinase
MMDTVGSLHMIIGPMCAGKTTELIRNANREAAIGRKVLLVNHKLDNRHDTPGLSTHTDKKHTDTSTFTTVSVSDFESLIIGRTYGFSLSEFDVVCIDELQFFESPTEMIKFLVDTFKKKVYAAGLIADYKQAAFGEVLPLLAFADSLNHCTGLCSQCNDGTTGMFTKRRKREKIIDKEEKSVISVGDCDDQYMLVCRKHFSQD